jgi:hypothetical protein
VNEKITVLISDDNNEFATTLANYLEKDEDMLLAWQKTERKH